MSVYALDLADVLTDQVRRLVGVHSRTQKAIAIFGQIGHQTQVSEFAGSESPLNARLRRSRVRRSLASIYVQGAGSFAETVATSILQIVGNSVKWSWNTITANYLILLLLASSAFINNYYSSRVSTEWWHERKAIKFMSRLGVGSDSPMSRAVYVNDLEDAIALDASIATNMIYSSECKDTFESIMNLSSPPDGYYAPDGTERLYTPRALHFRQTRQHLSTRRHDLLVAVRVVNSVEREMIKAEWEHWLIEETARCRQLETLLNTNLTSDTDYRLRRLQANKEAVRRWHSNYCPSCERDSKVALRL